MRVRRSVGMRLLTAARVLVAVMLLRPPSDTTGGFGVDEPPGYVYGCPVCDAEIPRRTEAIESGQEPPCKKNRAHGQVTLLRQV